MRAKGLPAAAEAGGGQVGVEGAGKEGLRQMGRVLGLASGVLAGLFGTGGPPLMVLVAVTEMGKDEWRASNAVIWLVDNVFRFAYLYAVQGQVRALGKGGGRGAGRRKVEMWGREFGLSFSAEAK